MSFQKSINYQQAPGVAGDFCTANPWSSYPSGEGRLVAGEGGCEVGKFAWIDKTTFTVTNKGSGAPDGFIHREGQAIIPEYMGRAGMYIAEGMGVTVLTKGDFYMQVKGDVKAGQPVMSDAEGNPGAAGTKTAWVFTSDATDGMVARTSSWVEAGASGGDGGNGGKGDKK